MGKEKEKKAQKNTKNILSHLKKSNNGQRIQNLYDLFGRDFRFIFL